MWESPIQMITDDIIKDITQKQDELLMESVHRVGFNIDKDELMKALNYDRDQYEKGYADGRWARDSEIVRCRDCKWYKTNYSWNGKEHKVCVIEPYEPARKEDDFCSRGERKETEDGVH